MPMHAIQGQYVGHHRYIYQHVIILSAIRLFKEPSFSIQHTDVDASHTCSICFAQYVQRMLDHMLWNSRFKKNLWHGYRLLCVIWTYLPWQWWIQRLPCESFQLGAAFLMSRSRSQDDNGSVFQKGKNFCSSKSAIYRANVSLTAPSMSSSNVIKPSRFDNRGATILHETISSVT